MSNWHIVEQDAGKQGDVKIKQISCFPQTDQYGNTTFIRTKMLILRVCYKHVSDPGIWKVCYTKHGFNFTCPDRQVKVNAWSDEHKTLPGRAFNGKATSGSMDLPKFIRELTKQVGKELADEIITLFLEEMPLQKAA